MEKINHLYPFGEGHDSYLEYRFSCRTCGQTIHLYLPAELSRAGYRMGQNTCHEFAYSIDRGLKELYENKVIKLRKESFGSRVLLFDSYHLYPIIPGESEEERKVRLTKIRRTELEALFTEQPEKKNRIIEELVNRNDAILHALEEILKVYEKAEPESMERLDQALLDTTQKDDAISLLKRFGVEGQQTVSPIHPEPVSPSFVQSFSMADDSFGTFAGSMEPPKKTTAAANEWTCSCGKKTTTKFCTECGRPRPGLL